MKQKKMNVGRNSLGYYEFKICFDQQSKDFGRNQFWLLLILNSVDKEQESLIDNSQTPLSWYT